MTDGNAHHLGSGLTEPPFVLRPGGPEDAQLLVSLFDGAVAWLVSRGYTAQWGDRPFSESERRVEHCRQRAASGGLWIAERSGEPVAAMALGEAPDYAPPPGEPELYVTSLVSAHSPGSAGAGARLLAHADVEGRRAGVGLLRVDCFAGNDGRLIRFYERCGYVRDSTFLVKDWPGQVLCRRLDNPA